MTDLEELRKVAEKVLTIDDDGPYQAYASAILKLIGEIERLRWAHEKIAEFRWAEKRGNEHSDLAVTLGQRIYEIQDIARAALATEPVKEG